MTLLNCENLIHQYSKWLGSLATILLILLLMNIFYDIVMRYLFNDVSIGMQELEWNFYASIFLLGVVQICICSWGAAKKGPQLTHVRNISLNLT